MSAGQRDEAATVAAIERCWNIDWRRDLNRLGSQVALMREYLRRSTLVAEAVGDTPNWPWFDAAARLTLPGVDRRFLSGYAALDENPNYLGPGSDLLEERIIAFNSHLSEAPGEQGYLDLDGDNSSLLRWERAAQKPPLPSLAPAALDELDRKDATPERKGL